MDLLSESWANPAFLVHVLIPGAILTCSGQPVMLHADASVPKWKFPILLSETPGSTSICPPPYLGCWNSLQSQAAQCAVLSHPQIKRSYGGMTSSPHIAKMLIQSAHKAISLLHSSNVRPVQMLFLFFKRKINPHSLHVNSLYKLVCSYPVTETEFRLSCGCRLLQIYPYLSP